MKDDEWIMKNYIGKVKNPIVGVLPFYFFTVLPLIFSTFLLQMSVFPP